MVVIMPVLSLAVRRSYGKRQRLRGIRVGRIRNDFPGKTRLPPDALEPCGEVLAPREVEARVARDVAVGENRHVGDGVAIAGNERPLGELAVEDVKSAISQRARRGDLARKTIELVGERPV